MAGTDPSGGVDELQGSGVERVYSLSSADLGQAVYSTDAAAIEELCRESAATIVVAVGTSRVARVVPGVAYRLDGRVDTHICAVDSSGGTLAVARWNYRQRMRALLSRSHRPWFLTADPGSFAPWSPQSSGESVEVVEVSGSEVECRTNVEGFQEPASGEQTIRPDAELLFVAGAGWTKTQGDGQVRVKDAEELILGFLEKTQASLGGSKSMVDLSTEGQEVLSFMTHLNQIGQTGSSPRHRKGLATCCHGEEPHVVGWRFVNERRVVNTDPNCGWVQGKADVVYVGDAFAVVSRVNEMLAE